MDSSLLSILVPLYNEEQFVAELLDRVLRAPLLDGMDREIIVVDDGSTDKSAGIVAALSATRPKIRLIRHNQNRGKGAAIRTAIEYAQGDYCVVQDADLEYDPSEYIKLLHPLVAGRADVVYGSRFLVAGERRVLYFWHSVANWMLTLLCNIVSDVNLSDMETCYKAFRTPLLKSIPLRCNRFGIEPEVTIKVARRKARMYEVPVSYYGRTYEDGKKIGMIDAFQAIWVIFRFAFTRDIHKDPETKTLPAVVDIPTQH